jgi:hypothetical protein
MAEYPILAHFNERLKKGKSQKEKISRRARSDS